MVTTDNPRWKFDHPEVPVHLGKVNGMGKFDAQFFRVHYKQACTMEPMSRKLLEHAYSAIYDSGQWILYMFTFDFIFYLFQGLFWLKM